MISCFLHVCPDLFQWRIGPIRVSLLLLALPCSEWVCFFSIKGVFFGRFIHTCESIVETQLARTIAALLKFVGAEHHAAAFIHAALHYGSWNIMTGNVFHSIAERKHSLWRSHRVGLDLFVQRLKRGIYVKGKAKFLRGALLYKYVSGYTEYFVKCVFQFHGDLEDIPCSLSRRSAMLYWRLMKYDSNSPASLFVGRWQPFHDGHKKLIETVLQKDKPVVVAIRDTEISHKNPYSTNERWAMIHRALREYGELVKIIVIPDIDEICYGRDVGYDVRRIELDKETEGISGTKTREASKPTHNIIWLTGQTGAGKSTLADELAPLIGAFILDNDEIRESLATDVGFSREDRHNHNLRVARYANSIAKQMPVIVSVIAPFEETRNAVNEIIKPIWVYIKRDLPSTEEKPYEPPTSPDLTVTVTEATDPKENAEHVLEFLQNRDSAK